MITKEKAEQIIDRLADKTLSFGCLIRFRLETETEADEHIGKFYGKNKDFISVKMSGYSVAIYDNYKILGHPVRLGDVLQKIALKYNNEEHGLDFIDRNDLIHSECPKVFELWLACGEREEAPKSLQTILSEAKMVDDSCYCEREGCTGPQDKLLGPASDLFELLDLIFNQKEDA